MKIPVCWREKPLRVGGMRGAGGLRLRRGERNMENFDTKSIDLSGPWRCEIPGKAGFVRLPGTLDEAGMGFPDTVAAPWHPDEPVNEALRGGDAIATRLTRKVTYEGPAKFTRRVRTEIPAGRRVLLECERARALELYVNGVRARELTEPTLSTPRRFEVTGLLTGDDEFTFISDNSYPGLPRRAIVTSSTATDETQTNWTGILGAVRLTVHGPAIFTSLRVYPRGGGLLVRWEIDGETAEPVILASPALRALAVAEAGAGECEPPLRPDARRWDVDEGNLYELTASLGEETETVRFGIRDFGALNGQFALNGRKIFLRSEANCAVFPETGHEPTDVKSWRRIIGTYRSYGVNHLRFHSHCPPEAAFAAADELGVLMQPELSHWDPRDAFGDEASRTYYRAELRAILREYANHPSFVMLTLGNELQAGEEGHRFMEELLDLAHATDPTRLFAPGSNNHYGERRTERGADFYTSFSYLGRPLRATMDGMRGWLNEGGSPDTDYSEAMAAVRADFSGPVMSFEVGQYEILPDFGEIDDFHGVTDPANLRLIRDKVEGRGLMPRWRAYTEATGELALLCYRAEVEAALATPGFGGISLLGLQDFPGQGTALVGMLNSHLKPKPGAFAAPERFRAFFSDCLPLLRFDRRTFNVSDGLFVPAVMANYGKTAAVGAPLWSLTGPGVDVGGSLMPVRVEPGSLARLGTVAMPLKGLPAPARYTLALELDGHRNEYGIWVYTDGAPVCPPSVYECRELDERAEEVLRGGGCVLLAPDSTEEALPNSVNGQFSTDFWSVGTFPWQSGAMGMFIDKNHPIFRDFPTGSHTDWQWWSMAGARAVRVPAGTESVVTLLDSYAYLRNLSYIFECRCLGGRLMVCTLGLRDIDAPEARALRRAVYTYMTSPDFAPSQEMGAETVRAILKGEI